MSSVDGRLIDVQFYQGPTGAGATLLQPALALPGSGGQVLAGVQKLVQRFLYLMFTAKGTIRYHPEVGCDFTTRIRQGFVRTPFDLLSLFSVSLVDISRQLKLIESSSDPDDERFASASVESATLTGDKATMTISLVTKAGTAVTFLAPTNVFSV